MIVAAADRCQAVPCAQLRIPILRAGKHDLAVVNDFDGAEQAHIRIRRRQPAAAHALLAFRRLGMVHRSNTALGARIATGWRLKQIAEALIVCTHAQTPEEILKPKRIPPGELQRCEELGATLGSGIAAGIF